MSANPLVVVDRFNDCINARDLAGLAELMSSDHTFIDAAGATITGRAACLVAWRHFFATYPDYRNIFTSMTPRDDLVVIVGLSMCAEPSLAGPALWTAQVRDDVVAQWRVYQDTPANRAELSIADDDP